MVNGCVLFAGTVYANTLQNFLKKNSKNNSFTAYFENESTSFRGVVLAKARKQATYAKRILKETVNSIFL